jgi:hypothetical protein
MPWRMEDTERKSPEVFSSDLARLSPEDVKKMVRELTDKNLIIYRPSSVFKTGDPQKVYGTRIQSGRRFIHSWKPID